MKEETNIHIKKIYRFNFSNTIIENILNFSRLNMYIERKIFKEKWIEWKETNKEELEIEYKRLITLGYTGDFNNKLFKATRYYFKDKQSTSNTEKVPSKSDTKRKYIFLDYDIIKLMENHIKEIYSKKIYSKEFKPSIGYNNFILLHKNSIDREIINLKNSDHLSLDTRDKCLSKLKKSYKNLCYNYINSIK